MTICGLDFGTSNSTIGVIQQGNNTMVPLEKDAQGQWQTTLPSALFFDFETDDIHFGRKAIADHTKGKPGRLLRAMKSLLGSPQMGDSTQFKHQFYSYDELIGFFVGSLKQKADKFLGDEAGPLESVVMGRPVYFNDDDPELDREAEEHLGSIARLAGFKNVSFQFEPIAAALDYEKQVTSEKLALIIDIGGGTSDFTVVRLSPERHHSADRKEDFLAHHGIHLGGTNFDSRLSVAGVMPEFGLGVPFRDRPSLVMPNHFYWTLATWHEIEQLYDRDMFYKLKDLSLELSDREPIERLLALLKARKGHQLGALVEQAKIDLSSKPEATVLLEELLDECMSDTGRDVTIKQEVLQQSIQGDVNKIFKALEETLTQSGLSYEDVDTVFTTGGSTALPMIKNLSHQYFSNAEHVAGDLYNSVGSGLLMEAVKRYG